MEKTIEIRRTKMGAQTLPVPIDPTLRVEKRWGKTHGQARISGHGKYLLINVSNSGKHRCQLIRRFEDGREVILDEAEGYAFCRLCESEA